MHDCPVPSKMATVTASAAALRLASAKTMCGDFPPSSRTAGISLLPARSEILRPTFVVYAAADNSSCTPVVAAVAAAESVVVVSPAAETALSVVETP